MISKKDLLKKMDISYGQLYRWKREGLIPDEWFVKQAVPSGQETFFDENLVVPRIQKILDLKDTYQLEEMRNLFTQNEPMPECPIRDAAFLSEINPLFLRMYLQVFDRKVVNLNELAFIYFFTLYEKEIDFCDYVGYFDKLDKIKCDGSSLYLLRDQKTKKNFFLCGKNMFIDYQLTVVAKHEIDELISIVAKKLKE